MSAVPQASTRTLSEAASKALLAPFGVPFPPERVAATPADAAAAAREVGFPVVAKLNGDTISHKTERGLVRLNLADGAAVEDAAADLLGAATPDDGDVSVLVAPMVSGLREFIAGMVVDPQFGPTVMLGVGGVLAEVVGDVAIRVVPLAVHDATDLLDDLATQGLFGALRGEPPVDRHALAAVLLALSAVAETHPEVVAVDLNPLIISGGQPVAVDALVEVTQ